MVNKIVTKTAAIKDNREQNQEFLVVVTSRLSYHVSIQSGPN